jgi:PKD repeat protein
MNTSTFLKQSLLTFLVSFFLTAMLQAEEVRYNDSWSNQGFTLKSAKNTGVQVIHSVNSFTLNPMTINGEEMTMVQMPGSLLPTNEGAPNLPGEARYIAMPVGATPKLKIIKMRVESIPGMNLAPSHNIPFEDDDSPLRFEKDMAIYAQDAFFPANPVKISEPTTIRGVDVVMLGITPFQYNPVTGELLVLRDIEVEIEFVGGNNQFGENRYRSRWWDPILADAILNFESLPEIDYNWIHERGDTKTEGCEYLIITPTGADYVAWADTIAEFRNMQGILTKVVTVDDVGGNSTYAIESYVNDAYNNWDIPPSAVLLLGDYGSSGSTNIISPIWDGYCASDNIFADVNGDDLPEMTFARITANNAAQLETMVSKFIDYETNPPTNPDFYNNPITAIGWQTERWFQLCGEVVGGFWKNELGMDPVRINDIYSGSPGASWSTAQNTATIVNYFGPNGLGYIPATPNVLGGWTGGNATQINNTINNGSFIMLHRDHGSTTGWGEPSYNNSSINGLTNSDLTFVMSINCLTGKYNMGGECFAEKFHRHTSGGHNSGALGITAASEVSYSFVNDTYVWGFIDNMWPSFMPDYGTTYPQQYAMPAFGNSSGKFFLEQSNWPYNTNNKTVTYHLFHHHGGAFLTLYYDVPTELSVQHNDYITYQSGSFEVQADMGSLIALYSEGEILAAVTAIGNMQTIPIPDDLPMGTEVTLTVTKQNKFRYEDVLLVEDGLIANFEANTTSTCDESSLDYTDLSEGEPIAWAWTFEGGEPETSTEQNPSGILYSTPGSYDVTLEVTSAFSTDTYTVEDYVTIRENVEVVGTVTAQSEEICEGQEATFVAEVENAGLAASYQWKVNGMDVGDGTDTYVTSDLADGDIVACEVTSALQCTLENPVMSNEIIMTVNENLPVSVSIETAGLQICEGSEVEFTALPVNGGDAPSYQWKVNGVDAGSDDPVFITNTLNNGDVVTCELTSNESCVTGNPSTSNPLTMNVVTELPVAVSIESDINDICAGEEVTFTATPENGGSQAVYQWKVNGENAGDNNPVFMSGELADGDVVSCELTSSFSCAVNNPATSNDVTMSVEPLPAAMETPDGPAFVDHFVSSSSSYSTTEDPNTNIYTWSVSPEEAWNELSVDMHNLTVTWNESYEGQASIEVYGTNNCGNGPVSLALEVSVDNTFSIADNDLNVGVSVFPNPNNGTFSIKLSSDKNEKVKIGIRNIVGESVLSEEEISVNGEFIKTIDLSKIAEGIYFLVIENNNRVLTEKIIVQR